VASRTGQVTTGKGNLTRQRRRRRQRYRGCRVCGLCGQQCTECELGAQIVAVHGYANLSLVVDGSFVEHEAIGHGGAGLVLVRGEEILASRACGFLSESSSDSELQAVIRGGRWAPGVSIYTDARDLAAQMMRINPHLAVQYLPPEKRGEAYAIAHRLSVEGRCRDAPQTLSPAGIEFVAQRAALTKNQRKVHALRRSVTLLLEHAQNDPGFDGDFTAIAARLGWNSGRRWQDNPAIQIAAERWQSTGDNKPGDSR
jgi:hypothetical protein